MHAQFFGENQCLLCFHRDNSVCTAWGSVTERSFVFLFCVLLAFHTCCCSPPRPSWRTRPPGSCWPQRQTWPEGGEGGPRAQGRSRYEAAKIHYPLLFCTGLSLHDRFTFLDLFLLLGMAGSAGLKGEKGDIGSAGKGALQEEVSSEASLEHIAQAFALTFHLRESTSVPQAPKTTE